MQFRLFIPVLFFLIFFQIQCTDPCEGVNCNNGTCIEGECDCDDGYEGTDCSVRKSAIFNGAWNGTFDCGELVEEATIQIEDDEMDIRKLTLQSEGIELGFNGFVFSLDNTILNATINQSYTGFAIDTQTMVIELPDNPGISAYVFGTGTLINESTLDLLIKVKNDDFGAAFQCEAEVSKQE